MSDLLLISPPRITRALFAQMLQTAHSPATSEAQVCYDRIVAHGVDPAIALAFFRHESQFGTAGAAVQTRNWGNLRKGQGKATGTLSGFATYARWADSADDWAALIADYYVRQRGLTTVETTIPVYAPSSDGNAPAAYVADVLRSVAAWQAQGDPWTAWGTRYPLPVEQRTFAVPAAWLRAGDLGAAESDEFAILIGAVRLFAHGAIIWTRQGDATRVYR